jgi:hypothetical protein
MHGHLREAERRLELALERKGEVSPAVEATALEGPP